MFESARIKLTLWYLLIIMVVCFLFSFVIYTNVNSELERIKYGQQQRLLFQRNQGFAAPAARMAPAISLEAITAAQERFRLILFIVNTGILAVSGVAAYFLSGRTLKPIKEMVDEQNRFITDASHELRTPLTALRSEIEVSLRDKNLTVKDTQDLLKSNLEEVIELQSLSDQLMQLAQYQKKISIISMEEVSVAEVMSASVHKVLHLAKRAEVTIDNKVNNYVVYGNKQSLVELFVTLLDNAVKYSQKKGSVIIDSKKTGNYILVSVKDNGVGIEKKDLPHIFDRFYRADKSRSKEISGYGLGLSIAKKIVDLHKGSINIESKVHKGTSVMVQIPMQ